MKTSKRILSLLLVVVMLFTMLPVPALATGSKPQTSVDTGDVTIEGTNGFGNLLSQEIQESQEESATAEEGYEAGYSVIDLTFEGATATVEYSSLEEARLVVAVYSEDGLQMLASGETTVSPDADMATVTIEGDMPEYFLASAYLMDTYDLSPLCAAYDTPMYTREMQELLESTVDDYAPDRVLNLDEDETTNFAVYAEDTILIEPVDGFNIVTTVDDENGVYVIENADEQITSLRVGDVFSYAYGENEIIIAKVAAITADGTTVTITSSDELEMDEVFSHVKIENAGDTDDLVIDESTVDEGLVYEGVETENGSIQPQAYDGSISHNTSLKYKIAYGDSKRGIEVSGSAKFSITLSLELYISWSYSRVEITLEPVVTFGAEIKSELASDGISLKMGQISLPFMYGAAKIKFTPKFVAEFSGSVGVEAKVSAKFGFYFETGKRGPKFQLIRISTCDGFELDAEVGLFAGLELTPEVEVLGGSVMEAKITGKIGVEATCSPNDRDTDENADVRHICVGCVDGDLSAVLSINASLKVLGKNALKKLASTDLSFVDWKAKFADFYLCFEHKDFGWGGCPRSEYRTTVYVKDSDENPLYNADVYVGDQKKQTDKKGIAVFYLKYGTYDISVDYEELYAQKNVGVNKAQKVTLIARPDDYPSGASENIFGSIIPDDIVDDTVVYVSGQCGDDLFWSLLNDGRLFITGTGPMWNYDLGEAPWYSERSSISEVWLGRGFVDEVTSIGDYAFADCTNLSWVVNADFVTYIGDFAFYGCKSLTNEGISDCVTTIGSNAFAHCTSLTSVDLPDSLTSIGINAFRECDSLRSVEIPDKVVTIGDTAFYSCDNLTSVTIGKSVTSIGNSAFNWCRKLANLKLSDSVTTIGDYAFNYCKGLTNIKIPDSVRTIGEGAFSSCDSLDSVTIGDGVITIGDSAFRGCDNLASVVIPDNVTTIGNSAFNSCTNLINVEIGDSVTTIGDHAFSACYNLSSVKIPDSVITIGDAAFITCDNLRSVTIGNRVTRIGDFAFEGCIRLTSVSIPDSVITIGDSAFEGCNFRSVKIGNNVTTIGNKAFSHSSLASVEIPDNVTTIGNSAFWDCNSLKSVTIGNGVTTIGNNAFDDCDNMVSVTIGYSVTTVGDYAFENCIRLEEIKFCGNAPTIGSHAFYCSYADYSVKSTAYYPASNTTWTSDVLKDYGGTITWVPYTLDGNGNMITNADAAFTVDAKVAEIGFPDVSVEAAMIQNNLQISEPDFGNREEPVNPNAVYDGEYSTIVTETYTLKTASFSGLVPGEQYVLLSMVSIDVEDPLAADNLLYIDQAEALEDGTLVFQYVQRTPTETSYVVACGASNKNLNDAEITFPEMVADGEIQVVNPTVVYGGKTLTEGQDYTIQGTVSVTEPGTYTCYIRGIRNYSGLVECTYAVITPYNEVAYGFCGDNMTWTFYDNGRLTISGMGEMKEFDYLSSVPWNDRRSSILAVIIEEGVTTISDFAFAECANLTSVKIGDSVTTVGDLAFSECTSLTSVKIPDSVTTIGSYVFQDCTNLSKVTIGNSLTNISACAFQCCSSLTNVMIGTSVATIGYGAFQSCTSLLNVTIPDSVTTIGNAAFKSCTSLSSVTIPDSVITIGSSAFSGCTSLTTVEIPESVTTIGDSAFGFCNNLTGIYVDERNPNYSNDDCGVLFDQEKNELIQAPGAISGSYEIPDSVSTISNDAFNYCTHLNGVEIPSSVTTIEYSAFESCTGMTSAVIPDGVIRIDNEAFKSCTSLTSVSIPDSVTYIGNEAFSSCTNLTSVLIGGSVDTIGNYAFRACTSLIAIDVDENNPNYSSDDWGVLFDKEKIELIQAPAALSGSYEVPGSVTTIASYAFRSCARLTSLTIPQSVDTIGNYAFSDCTGLQLITFMGDAPTINVGAFSSVTTTAYYPAINPTWSEDIFQNYGGTITWTPFCTEHSYEVVVNAPTCTEQGYTTHTCLMCGDSYITDETEALGHTYESVNTENGSLTYTCTVCGDSYTEVLPDAFLYSIYADHVEITGYTGNESELIIPSEIEGLPVTMIGAYAFYDCDTLVSINIPGNVRYLDSNAFGQCSNLTTINFDGDAPIFAPDAFNSVNADAYYYEKHLGWIPEVMMSYGGHIIWHALDASILRNLDYYVYEDYVEITGVSWGITELVIPDSIDGLPVTIIGDEAFKYHDQLTNVTLPDSITYIGDCAFENCTNLTSINIPDSVTYIGKYAFKQCENLSGSINIPDGITHIGDYAFYLCSSITGNVTIPVSPTTMGNGVYEFCSSLTGVTIQDGVTAIPDGTFWGCDGLTSIILPDTVTTIGAYAFSSCDRVTSIDIPASVTHIGDDAFSSCSRLKTIRFLGDVPEFGENVFLSVYGKAYYPGSNPTWTTEVMDNYEDYSISWVAEGEVFGMEIVSTPESGFVGQEPDLSDLCVELIYGNNIHRPIDNWYLTISEIDTTAAGKKNVTVRYGDFSDEFTFFVHETEPGIVLDPSLYPESDHNYGNNLVENKTLTWPGTIGLVLVFSEKTFVEDGCDWITVLDGKGNQLATFSGSEAAGVTLVIPGDTVKILLNSDYSNTGYGYSFDSITTLNTHHTSATIAPAMEPTCTEPGHTEGIICEICDQPQYTAIPALGHDLGEWETVAEASCTAKGVEQQQCSRCDYAEIRFYKAFGHVWDAGVVTIEPTKDTEGERLYTCTVCGTTKTETIPVSEHEHSYEPIVTAPTCTEQGYTTYTCRCGDSYTSDYVNALDHDMGDWETLLAATCTASGKEQRNCSRCNHSESREIAATGHSWDKGVVTREPTEETEGERLYICTACGATRTESIPVIGHEHSYEAAVTAPTCTEQGYTTYTCRCGESYTADYVDALGHAWGDWIVLLEPTTTEDGLEERSCTRCGHTEQRTVSKLENPFNDVALGSFYYEPVMWAVENGITNGTSATTFGPNDQCMRAHVVTFLWRAVGSPEPTRTDNPFVDVKPGDFYYKPVLWAVENGITSGMDATHFGPTAYCNRAQVVTFLYRTMGNPDVGAASNPFTDVAVGSFYEKPVLWAVENGVTAGMSATSFGPNSICNRAQIVTFLYRAFVD